LALVALADTSRVVAAAIGSVSVLALVRWVVGLCHLRSASVTVELDASRRWVTLSRIHPTFAESVLQDRYLSHRT
jgi:hypothetical protein